MAGSRGDQSRPVLGDDVGIRLDGAGDHDFAETQRRFDHQPVARSRRRVDREHHAGAIGGDLGLHDDGEQGLLVHALARAIGDHPVPVEGGPAVSESGDQRLISDHVVVGLVHARERGSRGVLGSGRGTHRDGARAHAVVLLEHGVTHRIRDRDRAHALPQCRCGASEAGGVLGFGCCRSEVVKELLPDAGLIERLTVRLCGDDETWWNRQAGGCHLAEVGPLAADRRRIAESKLLESDHQRSGRDVLVHELPFRVHCAPAMSPGPSTIMPRSPAVIPVGATSWRRAVRRSSGPRRAWSADDPSTPSGSSGRLPARSGPSSR